ncbi:MAG: hypothetical protein JRG96_09500 [Deltaproteobacteria bacterium]|nr:hypothetical protein [Deltaproteobacteria bacterium]MBW2421738.1 hypothetical protein [Deltaproteobacteria bacterium]
MTPRSIHLLGSSILPLTLLAQVACLALLAANPQDARADRYDDVGPLGAKPKVVESVEGFLVQPTGSGFTGSHIDYPNHLTQQAGSPLPDEAFDVDRLSNHRDQIDGAAGDFDGDGIGGKVLAYETNQLVQVRFQGTTNPPGLAEVKALQIVISENGITRSVYIPAGGTEDGSIAREAILPPRTDPDPGVTRHYDRGIRVAVGQLDDDPADEIVLGYWTQLETIQIVILDLADTNEDGLGDTLEIFSLTRADQQEMREADLTIARGGSTGRSSAAFALALGDYDGDLVDEVALVHPSPHVRSDLIEGFNQAEVVIYEFTGEPTDSVVVTDGGFTIGGLTFLTLFDPFLVHTGAILPSGGGTFKVPFPGQKGSLDPPGTHPSGTAVRLKRMIATAANLPYPSDPDIDRLGAPRESIVVGLQMQQENLNQAWHLPGALVWLRPSRFDDCDGSTQGNTRYCLLNQEPVLNHVRTDAGYGDRGTILPSTFCVDAAQLRDDPANPAQSGRDEIVMMYDPHLFVLRAIEGGDALKSSDSPPPPTPAPPASLVNADPDGSCYGNGTQYATQTAGACMELNLSTGGTRLDTDSYRGQQCSVTVADVNGHQDIQTQPGGVLRSEIMVELRHSDVFRLIGYAINVRRMGVFEVNPDDLTRNTAHDFLYFQREDFVFNPGQALPLPPALAIFSDVDGDSVFLTDPVSRYRVGVDQPLVMLGAPPIHFDVIGGSEIDPFDCFPELGCPFSAAYTQASEQAQTLSHTYNSDWYVSNTTSAGGGLFVKVEASLTTSYGQQFSSTDTITEGVAQVSQRSTAAGVDESLVQINQYDIWEYGILCDESGGGGTACDEDDTVAVVVPIQLGRNLFASWPRPDVDLGSYAMTHEAGNLLSYKSNSDMLAFLSDTDAVYSSETGFQISQTSETDVSVEIFETSSKEDTQGSIFSIDGSVSTSGSIGVVNVATSFSGGYSEERFVSKRADVNQSDAFDLRLGRAPSNQDSYTVTPYVYLRDGAFVLDYAVDGPTTCPFLDPSCVKTFLPNSFFASYADGPDPSFRLPQLRDVEKGLGDDTQDRIRRTTEILILPVDASGQQEPGDPSAAIKPGAMVDLRTRVHNYSLVALTAPTTVTFYDGDPAAPGTDAIGSRQIAGIPARGTVEIPTPVRWTIPPMSPARFASARVYAELHVGGQSEIHADNNIAWRPLSLVPEPGAGLLGGAALAVLGLLRGRRGLQRRR